MSNDKTEIPQTAPDIISATGVPALGCVKSIINKPAQVKRLKKLKITYPVKGNYEIY